MNENQPQSKDHFSMKEGYDAAYVITSAGAECAFPFISSDYGKERPGIGGLLAGGAILLVGGMTQNGGMWLFFWAWIIALAVQKFKSRKAIKEGAQLHTHNRHPYLAMRLVGNVNTALNIEPVICLAVAALVYQFSEVVGGFLMYGAVSVGVQRMFVARREQVTVDRMRDSRIEQEHLRNVYEGREEV